MSKESEESIEKLEKIHKKNTWYDEQGNLVDSKRAILIAAVEILKAIDRMQSTFEELLDQTEERQAVTVHIAAPPSLEEAVDDLIAGDLDN